MRLMTRLGLAVGSLGLVAGSLAVATAPGAAAAPTCAPAATVADHGYALPIGGNLSLDALNWGGGGSAANACAGAMVNDQIVVWQAAHAGVAADFTAVANGTGGLFSLVYTPGDQVSTSAPLCVSTVTDVERAYFRLRGCGDVTATYNAGTGTVTLAGTTPNNEWQNFSFPNAGDGFAQIEASTEGTPFFANDRAFGGDGSPVISYTNTTGENQIWAAISAP